MNLELHSAMWHIVITIEKPLTMQWFIMYAGYAVAGQGAVGGVKSPLLRTTLSVMRNSSIRPTKRFDSRDVLSILDPTLNRLGQYVSDTPCMEMGTVLIVLLKDPLMYILAVAPLRVTTYPAEWYVMRLWWLHHQSSFSAF